MTLPATDHDIDLGSDLGRDATLAAIREWNRMTPAQQAETDLNRLVAKHRRKLERERGRKGGR